jgi:transposase
MKGTITLNNMEQKRLFVLNRVGNGLSTAKEAAELLGLSIRQVRRMLAAYRGEGAAALAHGNRGRKPIHAVDLQVRRKVVELATTDKYRGCNHQHFTELLDAEGIVLSRSSVRRILLGAGLPSSRKCRPMKHRRRRERFSQEGMLLQVDGSDHNWLEDRGPRLTLIAAIDDATGKVPAAVFREQEDAHGYFLMLRQVVVKHGVPLAVYHDRHGIFRSNDKTETVAEQLAGKREPTQFGRLLEELEVRSIDAHSPQAKGRIERLFGTFQDRLVVELRLAEAKTLTEANQVLNRFLPNYSNQFAVPPSNPDVAYRPLPPNFQPDKVFCFKYARTVGLDNTVKLGEHRLQLLPSAKRKNYARARVEVHELLDGSIAVYHEDECVASKEAPKEAPALRARKGRLVAPATPLPESATVDHTGEPIEAAAPAESVDKLSDPIDAEIKSKPIHSSTPGPNHPWRRAYKQPMVTESVHS